MSQTADNISADAGPLSQPFFTATAGLADKSLNDLTSMNDHARDELAMSIINNMRELDSTLTAEEKAAIEEPVRNAVADSFKRMSMATTTGMVDIFKRQDNGFYRDIIAQAAQGAVDALRHDKI